MTRREGNLAKWTAGICQANGIDIHYLRTGRDRPPLIALHGLIGSGACLVPFARTLEDEFDVVLPDARGHGKSSAPSAGYSYGDLAGDVVGLIENLEIKAAILLGHSMGGMTAAVCAGRLGSTIRAVILVDPTFISSEWQRRVFESDLAHEHRRLLTSRRSDLLAQARLRSPHRSSEMIEYLVEARLETSIRAFEILTPPNPDYRELVRTIHVPILLVIGDSGVVTVDTARELQTLNPLLRYELISDVGHGLPYDEPKRLGSVVTSFVQSLDSLETGSAYAKMPPLRREWT